MDNTFFERLDFSDQRGRERDLGVQGNLQVPYALGSWLSGYVKTGGKLRSKSRENDNTQRYLYLYFGGVNGGLDELAELFPEAERSTGGQIGLRPTRSWTAPSPSRRRRASTWRASPRPSSTA